MTFPLPCFLSYLTIAPAFLAILSVPSFELLSYTYIIASGNSLLKSSITFLSFYFHYNKVLILLFFPFEFFPFLLFFLPRIVKIIIGMQVKKLNIYLYSQYTGDANVVNHNANICINIAIILYSFIYIK